MISYDTDKRQLIAELSDIRESIQKLEQLVVEGEPSQTPTESPKQSSDLFLSTPAAIYLVQDSVIKYVSPQLRQITGYYEIDLLGASPLKMVFRDDRPMMEKRLVRVLNEKTSSTEEYRILTQNAQIRWVMDVASYTRYGGEPAIVSVVLDITNRKNAEEILQGDSDKFHDLCENASDMIQCIAPDGRIIYVNQAWRDTLGYGDEEISNLSIFDIVHPDYREHCSELFQRVIAGEEVSGVEVLFISKQGVTIPVEGTANCKFENGKPVYTRGIFRDITERRKAQLEADKLVKEVQLINQQLQQSNKELSDFAYIASHDLQEPLRKVSSFGTLLQDSLEDDLDEDQAENLAYMIDGAKRMQSMINDLLTYSRLTTQAEPFENVDLNKVIEDITNFELAGALEESGGTIHVPKVLPSVYGDPLQLHQLFQNLVANGLKFRQQGISPVVTISSSPVQDNMIRINIQDNGIGIDEKYHEQIFTMFKRLHSRDTYPGTGIGLAVCKKIVHRHGGEIGIKSTLGKGSTFWFTLSRFGNAINGKEK